MSKVLKTVAVVAAVVAVSFAIPGVGTAIGTAIGVSISAGTAATIAAVASAVSSVAAAGAAALQKPPDMKGTVNEVVNGANMPIPIGLGRTYLGGMKIYDDSQNDPAGGVNKDRSQIFVGSHAGPISGFEQFLGDFSPINFPLSGGLLNGVASGYYGADGGYMWLNSRKGLRPETALSAPSPRVNFRNWSTARKLSGMACWSLTMEFDEDGQRYASGIPQFGMVAKWVLTYDPRKDSTYAGGSGTQRWADESTWAYGSAGTGFVAQGENPALQALMYARGRYMGPNNVKVAGAGIPQQFIDIPAFVDFANICDANGWTSGGAIYEGPGISRWDNLKRILAAGAARPAWVGGMLTLEITSPKVALATITADDLADGEIEVKAMSSWKDRFNTIVPRVRLETHKWDYQQLTAITEPTYLTEDGETKTDEVQYDLCQNSNQGAALAAYDLTNRREFTVKLNCKNNCRGFYPGEAIAVDISEAGLANQLCVIQSRMVDPATGSVQFMLRSETTAKHSWALTRTGVAPPTPTITAPEVIDQTVSDLNPLSGLLDNDVLSISEKTSLANDAADMEGRYGDLFARAAALGLPTTAIAAARTEWLATLASYSPAWNDTTQDTTIYTPAFPDEDFPTGWSTFGTISTTPSGAYTTVTEADATNSSAYLRAIATSGVVNCAAGVTVKKDAVATRGMGLRLNFLGGGSPKLTDVYINTVTGAASVVGAGGVFVLDTGTGEWFVGISQLSNADTTSVQVAFLPAPTNGSLVTGVANTGSVDVRGAPMLSVGNLRTLGHAWLTPTQFAYSKALTALAQAISGVDALTSIVIGGKTQINIAADSAGAIKTGQLPHGEVYTAKAGNTDYSTLGAWSVSVTSGTATASIGSATGILSLTALSGKATLTVQFVYGSVTRTYVVDVLQNNDPPTNSGSSGGSGSSASTAIVGNTTATTYDFTNAVSNIITVTAGPTGKVNLSAPLNFARIGTATGSSSVTGKWRWRVVGGSFADVTTEVAASGGATWNNTTGEGSDGYINCAPQKTGLTAGTPYEFQFAWRDNSGTVHHTVTDGVCSGTGV